MICMNLVIVESASKAKTIQKYLNTSPLLSHLGSFEVVASLGHVLDIPSKGMGIDLATWEVSYEPTASRKSIIKKILSLAKPARCVYIASDPDREGEAIAHHIRNLITKSSSNARIERVAFHEITQGAVVEAILHPRAFDNNLIDAQEARRALDRVVGYEASPLLWKRFSVCKLSAGRVQSAALKMIIDRFFSTRIAFI